MAEWQPIVTAPKDSTEVWLGAEGRVLVGYWSAKGSWHSSWSDDRLQWEPTNWMPFLIPDPPLPNGERG
jgi:hypothetical protein